MDDVEIEKRLTELEQRSKSNTRRIDKMEKITDEIHKMSESLIEITTEMKHTNSDVKEIKCKVDSLDSEPGKRWKETTKALTNAMLGAFGAAIAAGIMYLISL